MRGIYPEPGAYCGCALGRGQALTCTHSIRGKDANIATRKEVKLIGRIVDDLQNPRKLPILLTLMAPHLDGPALEAPMRTYIKDIHNFPNIHI